MKPTNVAHMRLMSAAQAAVTPMRLDATSEIGLFSNGLLSAIAVPGCSAIDARYNLVNEHAAWEQ